MWNYPRLQISIILFFCLVAFIILNKQWTGGSSGFVIALVSSLGIQAYYLLPYTPLVKPSVEKCDASDVEKANKVSLIISNVYMENRDVQPLIDLLKKREVDMVLLMEVDDWWNERLGEIDELYPHQIKKIHNNTYGMILYSKFPLIDYEVKNLQHNKVPSIYTKVELENGQQFSFHGVHPAPPIPLEYADNANEDKISMLKVGDMVAKDSLPTIVAGDYNYISWSETAQMFNANGKLFDARIGRGLYNTFHAKYWFIRWPLDHVYVTKEFKLIELERLPYIESDHFPMYVELCL